MSFKCNQSLSGCINETLGINECFTRNVFGMSVFK